MRLASSIFLSCLTITWSILALPGCAPRTRPNGPAAAAMGPRVVGEVAVVDEQHRFVLIDLDSNLYVPAPGAALRTTNARGETARLRASPEQKRPFVAADVIEGAPAVGDQVVR